MGASFFEEPHCPFYGLYSRTGILLAKLRLLFKACAKRGLFLGKSLWLRSRLWLEPELQKLLCTCSMTCTSSPGKVPDCQTLDFSFVMPAKQRRSMTLQWLTIPNLPRLTPPRCQ